MSAARILQPSETLESGITLQTAPLFKTVIDYWDERSVTYSNGIWDELNDGHCSAWKRLLSNKIEHVAEGIAPSEIHVLDVGCGPGFFEIILSDMGFGVFGVDSSEKMLSHARANVAAAGNPKMVEFACADASSLPFEADTFDVVLSRNVTWLMKDPVAAYAEWQRVLKPGGILLVFDANWYTYLNDPDLNHTRLSNQQDASILEWGDDSFASEAQECRCEKIALQLPLTYRQRPAWDVYALSCLGFTSILADESVYRHVWNKGEQDFYATSPLFSIEARKAI